MRTVRPSDLTLASKGLILLAIPFVFEILIVTVLWVMLNGSDERAHNIAVSRDIILKLGHLSARLMQSCESMMMYSFAGKASDLDVYTKGRPRVYEVLDMLDKVFSETGRDKALFLRLKRSTDAIDTVLARYKAESSNSAFGFSRLQQVHALRRSLQALSPEFKAAVGEITAVEKVTESQNTARDASFRRWIQILLVVAFILSVVITGLLSAFFYQNIVSRIRDLEEKSRQLGQGKVVGPPVSGKDEIAVLHRAIHQASEDLALAAKEKQKVATMLSHDLRAPLMSIQGSLALVVKGLYGTLNDEGIARMRNAENSVERLVEMISQFLSTEKLNTAAALNLESARLGELFEQSLEMLSGTASNANVICRDSDVKMTVDVTLMIRVLTNLIGNAVKFSPPNGSIIVSGSCRDDGTVEILVSDEGPGVPPEARESIFEMYTQTEDGKKVPKSSGLGLAICKEIVTRHGGEIKVANTGGAGATFSVTLPERN